MSIKTDIEKVHSIDILDIKGRMVIIRVEDPKHYASSDDLTRILRRNGAAIVLIARPEDKIETLSDQQLAHIGLQRLN